MNLLQKQNFRDISEMLLENVYQQILELKIKFSDDIVFIKGL